MTSSEVLPLAREVENGSVTTPLGFLADGRYVGIKEPGPDKRDLGVLVSDRPCAVAGVFTRNELRAAPVRYCEELLRTGQPRGVIVNSGIANACTGAQGAENAATMARAAARALGLDEGQMLVCSTGVVGVQLPMDRIQAGIKQLSPEQDGGHRFARAIMTTDYRPKERAVTVEIDGKPISVGGAAKGAGMIHPGMATLLVFLTTDASVAAEHLQPLLRAVADRSFNMITVDGDTSTNDTMLLFANGASDVSLAPGMPGWDAFRAAIEDVAIDLAKRVVREAEGATRLFEVRITGAPSEDAARCMARAVTSSSLVKAAVHGADPNWGRILVAIGNAGIPVDATRIQVSIGGIDVMRDGAPVDYDEPAASAALAQDGAVIAVDLGLGEGSATAWGCDLSEEYVTFNSEYKT